jgi:hypothetical protein
MGRQRGASHDAWRRRTGSRHGVVRVDVGWLGRGGGRIGEKHGLAWVLAQGQRN